jgi:thioredoxin reductase
MATMRGKIIYKQNPSVFHMFTNGASSVPAADRTQYESRGVSFNEGAVKGFEYNDDSSTVTVVVEEGKEDGKVITRHEFDLVYYSPPFQLHSSQIVKDLGCDLDAMGLIKVDAKFGTNVKGISAAGDCTTMMRTVANAVSQGQMAALWTNHEMTAAWL